MSILIWNFEWDFICFPMGYLNPFWKVYLIIQVYTKSGYMYHKDFMFQIKNYFCKLLFLYKLDLSGS